MEGENPLNWIVQKRYSDFVKLNQDNAKLIKQLTRDDVHKINLGDLPPKILNRNKKELDKRKTHLELYLNKLQDLMRYQTKFSYSFLHFLEFPMIMKTLFTSIKPVDFDQFVLKSNLQA